MSTRLSAINTSSSMTKMRLVFLSSPGAVPSKVAMILGLKNPYDLTLSPCPVELLIGHILCLLKGRGKPNDPVEIVYRLKCGQTAMTRIPELHVFSSLVCRR